MDISRVQGSFVLWVPFCSIGIQDFALFGHKGGYIGDHIGN